MSVDNMDESVGDLIRTSNPETQQRIVIATTLMYMCALGLYCRSGPVWGHGQLRLCKDQPGCSRVVGGLPQRAQVFLAANLTPTATQIVTSNSSRQH